MPRFYFHLLNDVDAPDHEGKELPDLDSAREHARYSARITIAETIKDQGRFNLDRRIDVEDERGQVLDTIWFRDVVKVDLRTFD